TYFTRKVIRTSELGCRVANVGSDESLPVASGCELLLVVAASITGGASFDMAATIGGAGWEFVGVFESSVEADGEAAADGEGGKGCAAPVLAASFAVLRESFEAP